MFGWDVAGMRNQALMKAMSFLLTRVIGVLDVERAGDFVA